MEKIKESICLEGLDKILASEFPVNYYSLDGYSEEAVCLQKVDDSHWEVYVGIRNQHDDAIVYDDIIDACLGVIKKMVAGNLYEEQRLCNSFFDIMQIHTTYKVVAG